MANDPIIVDDGGSTRIKLLNSGVGAMNHLLDVGNLTLPAGRPYVGFPGSQFLKKHDAGFPYGSMTLTYLDSKGLAVTLALTFTDFQVVSGGQCVRGEVMGSSPPPLDPDLPTPAPGDLLITVHGLGADEPLVDAKQHKKKRRYIVANAPPIDQVFIDGAAVPVFQAPIGTRPLIPANAAVVPPVIYSTVIVT